MRLRHQLESHTVMQESVLKKKREGCHVSDYRKNIGK